MYDPETAPPKEILDNPELMIVWEGLVVSIKGSGLTRRQAYEIVTGQKMPMGEQPVEEWYVGEGYDRIHRFGEQMLGKDF